MSEELMGEDLKGAVTRLRSLSHPMKEWAYGEDVRLVLDQLNVLVRALQEEQAIAVRAQERAEKAAVECARLKALVIEACDVAGTTNQEVLDLATGLLAGLKEKPPRR